MFSHCRLARPVGNLERAEKMYRDGLGLEILARFADHAGFSGVILGRQGDNYHIEFTQRSFAPVSPTPTPEDLIVFYIEDFALWQASCAQMLAAGFVPVEPSNPYWSLQGATFADPDGYQTVLRNGGWNPASVVPAET
ncbi:MAG: VOC family protein [Burkholderiaceae bacterium]|jgi:catechol 2,3-dioxygenase-like lactoylglutathione lyase family enzyme